MPLHQITHLTSYTSLLPTNTPTYNYPSTLNHLITIPQLTFIIEENTSPELMVRMVEGKQVRGGWLRWSEVR